jgi:leucyl aminopeptidase
VPILIPAGSAEATSALSLTLLTPGEVDAWRSGQSAATTDWLAASGFTGKAGSLALLPGETGGKAAAVYVAAALNDPFALADLPRRLPVGLWKAALATGALPADAADALALGWGLGAYGFDRYKTEKLPAPARLVWPEAANTLRTGAVIDAVTLCRDLVNTPANHLGTVELAAAAKAVAAEFGASYSEIVGDDLLAQNYPAIHAVGRGSERAPRLVDLRWGKEEAPRVTIVGKGVVFDTGGYDLKPSGGMLLMKKDMGGAAHALGVARIVMALGLPVRLRVLLPIVENSVSGNAFRPLDVLASRKGLSIEVGNTDAEGRVILSDALAEASSEKPELLVDFATLTGAARVALGPDLPAMFAREDATAEALLAAGKLAADPMWRLPLWEGYRKSIRGKVGDINNSGDMPMAGAITAALFLDAFVDAGTDWVHIDTFAWNSGNRPGRPEGGEALGLRAVATLIEKRFAAGT